MIKNIQNDGKWPEMAKLLTTTKQYLKLTNIRHMAKIASNYQTWLERAQNDLIRKTWPKNDEKWSKCTKVVKNTNNGKNDPKPVKLNLFRKKYIKWHKMSQNHRYFWSTFSLFGKNQDFCAVFKYLSCYSVVIVLQCYSTLNVYVQIFSLIFLYKLLPYNFHVQVRTLIVSLIRSFPLLRLTRPLP